jgi:hypothetical protein
MRRRVQIQANDVGRFGFKVQIVRCHVALDPVWLQTVLATDSSYHNVTNVQVSPELARVPVRLKNSSPRIRKFICTVIEMKEEN